jgi:hypothetical protein
VHFRAVRVIATGTLNFFVRVYLSYLIVTTGSADTFSTTIARLSVVEGLRRFSAQAKVIANHDD